ncbi:hypothetical protein E9840_02565 [Tissierella creatinini]|nr:hypothetical protein E9840_02565 [Tissierella creatinini]TJX64660.1 hypothetical protein E8P77_11295 [Soehngenia saccharolytica]
MDLKSYDDVTRYITEECLLIYKGKDTIQAMELALHLMDFPKLKMHCPQHHYLIPAAMLTASYKTQGRSVESLQSDLMEAMMRAKNILPAFCGLYGSCGAAVGLGIYLSILTDSNQYSVHTWALTNKVVGECLLKISEIDGPRCCKRNSYIALQIGEKFSKEELGLDLGTTESIQCTHYQKNLEECKKGECPFYNFSTPIEVYKV